ncbi:MAG: flagellar biosynthetic protein FliR [Acidimicrobiia bacterium]
MKLTFDQAALAAFTLALVRSTVWVFVVVPFSLRAVPQVVKLGLAASLALVAAPSIDHSMIPTDLGGFIIAALMQAMIGFALAFLIVVLFSAVQAAGGLIDDFAGFNLAAMLDPMADTNNGPFGRLYQLVAITLLFATNLYLVLVKGFLKSFTAIQGVHLADVLRLLMHDLDTFLISALEIAGPVLAVLFLTEVALGLLARTAPAMNIFALAFPIRITIALVATSVTLPFVLPAVENLVTTGVRQVLAL